MPIPAVSSNCSMLLPGWGLSSQIRTRRHKERQREYMRSNRSGIPSGDDERFWALADELVRSHAIVIDRPRGSQHPRMPEIVYPLDYGFLDGTVAVDGGGVDVWRGSLPELRVTAIIATVDVYKGDAE